MTEPTARPLTTQLLIDLTTHPLDPGYATAAERRQGRPAPWGLPERVAVAVGCGLIGFLLVVAYVHTHRSAPATAKAHDGLVTRVRQQQRAVDSLAADAQRLASAADRIRDAGLSGGAVDVGDLNRSQLLAGEVAVRGPGLEVVLSDPAKPTGSATKGRAGTGSIADGTTLTDRDVRSVVNELWHDGAEAIAVNGIRLTPTSAIRFAGEAVLVDFQPITSPYTIRAIGDRDGLATSFAVSDVASRYHTLVSADGIGFSFTESSKLTLPAGTAVTPRYASVAASPSRTPTPAATR